MLLYHPFTCVPHIQYGVWRGFRDGYDEGQLYQAKRVAVGFRDLALCFFTVPL